MKVRVIKNCNYKRNNKILFLLNFIINNNNLNNNNSNTLKPTINVLCWILKYGRPKLTTTVDVTFPTLTKLN